MLIYKFIGSVRTSGGLHNQSAVQPDAEHKTQFAVQPVGCCIEFSVTTTNKKQISGSGVHPKTIWKREGKGTLSARHTVMGFSGAVGREIRRFAWIGYSFVGLWFWGMRVFLSLC